MILAFFFIVRILFSFTPFNNIFAFVTPLIQFLLQPLIVSTTTIILIFFSKHVMFFGIHLNVVYAVVISVMTADMLANMNAYRQYQVLPYLAIAAFLMLVEIHLAVNEVPIA